MLQIDSESSFHRDGACAANVRAPKQTVLGNGGTPSSVSVDERKVRPGL